MRLPHRWPRNRAPTLRASSISWANASGSKPRLMPFAWRQSWAKTCSRSSQRRRRRLKSLTSSGRFIIRTRDPSRTPSSPAFYYCAITITSSFSYIGSDKAIADLNVLQRQVSSMLHVFVWLISPLTASPSQFASGGVLTYIFWRSAYLSTLFSLRNRTLVATDWMKVKLFGRSAFRFTCTVFSPGSFMLLTQGRKPRMTNPGH
jgi:hypothetical protein